MDSSQGDTSREHKDTYDNDTIEDDEDDLFVLESMAGNEKEASSSSSSSSEDSSEEDFFQLDPIELNRALEGRTSISPNEHIFAEPQLQMGRPSSPNASDASPRRQSPPVQVMARTDVPDPNRIPSSIFERTKSSTTPMEWSVASNESLFSIHMGNSSFSRDHVILLGRSGELSSTPPIPALASGELSSTPPKYPVPNSYTPANVDMEQGLVQPGAAAAANAEAMKDVLRAAAEEHADKREPPADETGFCASISYKSDGSTTSFQSFAFPILTGEGRSASVKVEPESQQKKMEQPYQPPLETPEIVPAATENKWFSCFSCCTFCR